MSYLDPAWEEYLYTGIDPTGGDLGVEDEPGTYDDSEEENEYDGQESGANLVIGLGGVLDHLDALTRKLAFIEQLPKGLRESFVSSMNRGWNPFDNPLLMRDTQGLRLRSFNAIDIRTANDSPESICRFSIVIVRNGEVVERIDSLVRPEPNFYEPRMQEQHGLSRTDTDNVRAFKRAWNRHRAKLKDHRVLVAYDAPRVRRCLKAAFGAFNVEDPEFWFIDVKPSRGAVKEQDTLKTAMSCAERAMETIPLSSIL